MSSRPSLTGKEHVRRYQETDGAVGHEWEGTVTLLLTTTGHRSGQPRTTPVIYGRAGHDYVIVASDDGRDGYPTWYSNLRTSPEVVPQVGAEKFRARGRDASDEERPELVGHDGQSLAGPRRIPAAD